MKTKSGKIAGSLSGWPFPEALDRQELFMKQKENAMNVAKRWVMAAGFMLAAAAAQAGVTVTKVGWERSAKQDF
jgi:hypothetical protein